MTPEDKEPRKETPASSEDISFEGMMQKVMRECGCAGMMEKMVDCCPSAHGEAPETEEPKAE